MPKSITFYWKPGCSSCKAARALIAERHPEFAVRSLFREPLTPAELTRLGQAAGGLRELVAVTRRQEAAAVAEPLLADWLAADATRLRRPIVEIDGHVSLGFTAATRAELAARL